MQINLNALSMGIDFLRVKAIKGIKKSNKFDFTKIKVFSIIKNTSLRRKHQIIEIQIVQQIVPLYPAQLLNLLENKRDHQSIGAKISPFLLLSLCWKTLLDSDGQCTGIKSLSQAVVPIHSQTTFNQPRPLHMGPAPLKLTT